LAALIATNLNPTVAPKNLEQWLALAAEVAAGPVPS